MNCLSCVSLWESHIVSRNSVKYASNIYTDRDEKIECYIRDIDSMYKNYEHEYITYRPGIILKEIDRILEANHFPLLVKPRLQKRTGRKKEKLRI